MSIPRAFELALNKVAQLVAILAISVSLHAQSTAVVQGITGAVEDPTGAAVPRASSWGGR